MVLGLIELLLGKKKKKRINLQNIYKTSPGIIQQTQPNNITTNNVSNSAVGFNESTQNQAQQTQVANNQSTTENTFTTTTNNIGAQKRPISEVLNKIQTTLKENNEKIVELVSEIKKIENSVSSLTHRVELLEENNKIYEEKFNDIDQNLNKFLSLYELVNNQYNPFVEKEKPKKPEIVINESTSKNELNDLKEKNEPKFDIFKDKEDSTTAFLELDTLDIKEAAGNAVPLVKIKNDTNSLVIILSWLEYMINKVGINETRNTLRYYTEVLKWLTPEVYFELDKYLRGMRDKSDLKGDERLSIKDHIVSLYFISKLNEKPLDEKLTKAVLNLIKQ